MRISTILLVLMLLFGVSFFLENRVNAQTSYVTVIGQLSYYQSSFYLTKNGTTAGVPSSILLDFSQSIVQAPAQTDVGKTIAATGYYAQESQCSEVNGCLAFFVRTWAPYSGGASVPSPGTGCWSSSNPPTTWYSVQCGTAPTGIIPPTTNSLQAITSNLMSQFTTLANTSSGLETSSGQIAPFTYLVIAIILIVLGLLGHSLIHRKK